MGSTLNSRKGFTLLELMIAIAIIAVLSTVGLVIYSKAVSKGRDGKRIADLEEVKLALVQYRTVNATLCLTPGRTDCYWSGSFSDEDWGAEGRYSNSLKNVLVPKYLQKVPQDPIRKDSILNYYVTITSDGSRFRLSAKLDNPPTSNQCQPPGFHNYCISE